MNDNGKTPANFSASHYFKVTLSSLSRLIPNLLIRLIRLILTCLFCLSQAKQKRNSCIAAMSESSQFQMPASTTPHDTKSRTDSLPASGSARDSVTSLHNISSHQPSPVDRAARTSNKNFRKMSQLIFSNYTNVNKNKEQLKACMDKILDEFLLELPRLPDKLGASCYDPSMLEVEADWSKFVGEAFAQTLPRNQAKQQMALWELIVTESSHIKTTKVIIDVFLSCLVGLKCHEATCELFKEIEVGKLFSNIIEVFNCNLKFWTEFVFPIVEGLKRTERKVIDTESLAGAFADFKEMFKPYEEFIVEKADSLENFKRHTEENEFFARFITWAENNPLVGRLKIADFMMIPVQRLTKYELLLKKIHQFTEDEAKRAQIAFMVGELFISLGLNVRRYHEFITRIKKGNY